MLSALAVVAVQIFTMPDKPALNEEWLLDAIIQVENWDGKTFGAAGEWGHFQIRPEVWRSYSRINQRSASMDQERDIARKHLRWIRGQFVVKKIPLTPYFLGLGWAAGVTAVEQRAASRAKQDYAQRVENLYATNAASRSRSGVLTRPAP